MNTQPMNPNDQQANIELRMRTLRTLWMALLLSIVAYYMFTIFFFKPSGEPRPNPTLSLALLLAGIATTLVSFLIKNRLLSRAAEQQQVAWVQQAYIAGWAINEVGALLGVFDLFVTGHRHYYILFIVAACGLLLQFPRREAVINAAYKNPGF
ncbi:MAG TPA: hypothetical protein VN724_08595 [Pyrinomonadaceae bacterium]|nr:hypothetical protein [Pyrinomonadaceae bacterium]